MTVNELWKILIILEIWYYLLLKNLVLKLNTDELLKYHIIKIELNIISYYYNKKLGVYVCTNM